MLGQHDTPSQQQFFKSAMTYAGVAAPDMDMVSCACRTDKTKAAVSQTRHAWSAGTLTEQRDDVAQWVLVDMRCSFLGTLGGNIYTLIEMPMRCSTCRWRRWRDGPISVSGDAIRRCKMTANPRLYLNSHLDDLYHIS